MTPVLSQASRLGLRETARVVGYFLRARFQLRGTQQGARVRSVGRLLVPQRDGVSVGQRTVFLGGSIPTSLRCAPGAELVIGERSVLNYGVDVSASRSVRIGSDCMIGSMVHIRDDDGRRAAPVVIGKGVWIAYGAVIEPGTVIGDGAVVSAMAVVSGVVPPHSLAAGNPAHSFPLERDGAPPAIATGAEDGVDDRGEAVESAPAGPSADAEQVRSAIIEWLDETRLFGEAASRLTSDTMSLRDGGLLDSLGLVELLLELEGRFGVAIDRERAGRPDAQSLRSLVELVTHAGAARA